MIGISFGGGAASAPPHKLDQHGPQEEKGGA